MTTNSGAGARDRWAGSKPTSVFHAPLRQRRAYRRVERDVAAAHVVAQLDQQSCQRAHAGSGHGDHVNSHRAGFRIHRERFLARA